MMALRQLNHHTATYDPVIKRLQLCYLFSYPPLDWLGSFHIAKRDLEWKNHDDLSSITVLQGNRRNFSPWRPKRTQVNWVKYPRRLARQRQAYFSYRAKNPGEVESGLLVSP
jgi:hypothetical protein